MLHSEDLHQQPTTEPIFGGFWLKSVSDVGTAFKNFVSNRKTNKKNLSISAIEMYFWY